MSARACRLQQYVSECIPPGPEGPPGPQGAQGVPGSFSGIGDTGTQGPIGSTGYTGAQGLIGPTGYTGSTGFTGPQGVIGPQGVAGPKGAIGSVGPFGPAGPQGLIGPPGYGYAGEQGDQGIEGPQGPAGTNGSVGAQGSRGIQGTAGIVGLQGQQGPIGPNGLVGAAGLVGQSMWTPVYYPAGNVAPSLNTPGTFTKVAGSNGAWDSSVRSAQAYLTGCFVSFSVPTVGFYAVGISDRIPANYIPTNVVPPSATGYYITTDMSSSPVATYWADGVSLGTSTYMACDTFSIIYDGYYLTYYQETAGIDCLCVYERFKVIRPITAGLYLDTSFYYQNYSVTDLVFGPMGTMGFQGFQGIQGNQGFQGFQGIQGNQGIQGSQGIQGIQGDFGSGQWTPTFYGTGIIQRTTGSTYTLIAGTNGAVRSVERYINCYVSFTTPVTTSTAYWYCGIGLSYYNPSSYPPPSANAPNYMNMAFAIDIYPTGGFIETYAGGASGNTYPYTPGDSFLLICDNVSARIYQTTSAGTTLIHTFSQPPPNPQQSLYLDSAFYDLNS